MKASYVIGPEDLTIPVLIAAGVDVSKNLPSEGWYRSKIARTLQLSTWAKEGKYGVLDAPVFAGLQCFDFDSARVAGRMAGESDVHCLALGMGAVLGDKTTTLTQRRDGTETALAQVTAQPLMRMAQIIAGAVLGHVEGCGSSPNVHVLGAGTPVSVPIIAGLSPHDAYFAADSTAPIQDGLMTLSLYVASPAPLKLKAVNIVERWLKADVSWSCSCPYCVSFTTAHPARLEVARKWWLSENRRELSASDLRRTPLADALPLFGVPTDGAVAAAAGLSRVLHNHWVLRLLELASRRAAGTPALQQAWTTRQLDSYAIHAGSPTWRASGREALTVIQSVSDVVAKAAPALQRIQAGKPMR